MNVKHFKAELSDLLNRFAATDSDKNVSLDSAPLTTQEIIDAAQEVFLLKLDVNFVGLIRGQVKTPASGIVMTIPDAPDIPKFNTENKDGIVGRIRSLGTLWGKTFDEPNIDELDSLDLKVDENVNVIKINVPENVTHRKLVSKSNPEVNTLIRSDTFVCENASDNGENGEIFTTKNFDSLSINDGSECPTQDLTTILSKLKILRDSANDVVKHIDDINKEVPAHKNVVENSQSIRRLSAMGGYPGLHRTSTTSRTIQRPKMMRRSMLAALPGTPTSSRLSPEEPKAKDVSITRKSTSTIPIINMEGSKLSIPATYRSVSSGALTLSKRSATRYESPTHGSQVSGVTTKRKSSLRSPSLSSLNLKSRSGSKETQNRIYAQVQISKDTIALGNQKAY